MDIIRGTDSAKPLAGQASIAITDKVMATGLATHSNPSGSTINPGVPYATAYEPTRQDLSASVPHSPYEATRQIKPMAILDNFGFRKG